MSEEYIIAAKNNDRTAVRFFFASAIVIIFGIYVFFEYHIDFDILTEFVSEVDFFTEVRMFLSDPGIFYERLISNKTFLEIFKDSRYHLTMYLVFSLCLGEYLTDFFIYISKFKKACAINSRLLRVVVIVVDYIDGFFIGFIANYLFLFLFEKVAVIPKTAYRIWMTLLSGITGSVPIPKWLDSPIVILLLIALVIISVLVAIGLWFVVVFKIMPQLIKYLIILLIMMFVDVSSWPVIVPILITVTLRIIFAVIGRNSDDTAVSIPI